MYTATQIIDDAFDHGDLWLSADDYAEPGYTLGEGKIGIIFASWSPKTWDSPTKAQRLMPRLAAIAERAGYEVEWEDEWTTCCGCGKALRTSADSYQWKRAYWDCGDGAVCAKCLDPAEYLESIEGNADHCNTFDNINPSDHGYVLVKEGMANGWYGGQNDSPDVVAKSLLAQGVWRFVFNLDSVGQFDTHFSVYVHETEEALLEPEAVESVLPYDPGTEMGKALRGEHSNYYTMTTTTITPEEFVSGTWTKRLG